MAENEFDPRIEAAKDTIFLRLAREEVKAWAEYEDIKAHTEREYAKYPTDVDLSRLTDLCGDAFVLFRRAENAASDRYNTVLITLGG